MLAHGGILREVASDPRLASSLLDSLEIALLSRRSARSTTEEDHPMGNPDSSALLSRCCAPLGALGARLAEEGAQGQRLAARAAAALAGALGANHADAAVAEAALRSLRWLCRIPCCRVRPAPPRPASPALIHLAPRGGRCRLVAGELRFFQLRRRDS